MQPLNDRLPAFTPSELKELAAEWRARAGVVLRRIQPTSMTRAIIGVEVTLTIVFAAVSATLVWKAFEPPAWASAGETVQTSAPSRRTAMAAILTDLDPFHRASAGDRAVAAARAPETMLNLQLFGIRAGLAGAPGSAIVATPDNTQGVYAVGQEIMPGVRLEQVLQDRVVIRRNGVTESLSFDRESTLRQNAAAVPTGATAQVSGDADERRLDLDAMKSLAVALRFSPAERGGSRGLLLEGSAEPSLLQQTGLEPGDLLLTVNGTPVSEADALTSFAVTNLSSLTLEIERKGQRKIHRLSIDRAQ
jgi:general secretion pathway protein C